MAIRYSGDTEIRVVLDRKTATFHATVRDPRQRWSGGWRASFLDAWRKPDYDKAAEHAFRLASKESLRPFQAEMKGKSLQIRRVFQAPCPTGCPHERAPKKGSRRRKRPRVL